MQIFFAFLVSLICLARVSGAVALSSKDASALKDTSGALPHDMPCHISRQTRDSLRKLNLVASKQPIDLTKELLDHVLQLLALTSEPIQRQDYGTMDTALHGLVDIGLGWLKETLLQYQQETGISSLGRNKLLLAIVGWLRSDSARLQEACLRHADIAKILNASSFEALKSALACLFDLFSLSTTDQTLFFATIIRLHGTLKESVTDMVGSVFAFCGYPGALFLYSIYLPAAIQAAVFRLTALRQKLQGPDCNPPYKVIRDWLRSVTQSLGMEISLPLTVLCNKEPTAAQ